MMMQDGKIITYCCGTLKRYKGEYDFFYYEDNKICLNVWDDAEMSHLYEQINYCPFCGKKIEIK